MTSTRRDLVVVLVLVVALVGLGGVIALPPAGRENATPTHTDAPTLPPPVAYREGVVGVPQSITPVTARSRSERTLVGLIFSGLVRLGPDDALEPDLAASWTVDPDGRTWTFSIRPGATWHDGVPVTSADVVYTVDALKSPEAAGAVSASWADVTATAVDARTVVFHLQTPIAGFLAAVTQPLLPVHLLRDVPFADLATSDFARQPVGTGPYTLDTLDDTGAVLTPASLLDAAPSSPAPTPSLDSLATPRPASTPVGAVPDIEEIQVRFYPDDAAAAAALRAGEIDGVAGLGPAAAAELAGVTGIDAIRYPTTTLAAVLLDLRPTHPELRDARVRQALLAALDRDTLVTKVFGGDAVRADALVPSASWAFDPAAAPPVAFNRKQASTLLTAAGWTKVAGSWRAPKATKAYRLELLGMPADANPRLAAVAAWTRDAWQAAGIQVDLVTLPAAELAPRLRSGDFTAAVVDIAMGLEPDLYPLLASSQVRASGSNLSGYQDTALDGLLEAARTPGTIEKRTAAWKALLVALAARQPILPLAWNDEVAFVRGVEGVVPRLIASPGDRFWDVLAWRLAASR